MSEFIENGFIKLHRRIQKHWIFKREDYFRAWVMILFEARWSKETNKVLVGNQLLDCRRGESLNSLRTWAKMFGTTWTVKKVRTFFSLLEKDGMIVTEGYQKTTRLTICNYETYQDRGQVEGTPQGIQRANSGQTAGIQRANSGQQKKKEKNIKKEKIRTLLFLISTRNLLTSGF